MDKSRYMRLALLLGAGIGCGSLQLDGVWDIFDVGYFMCWLAIFWEIVSE